MRIYNTCLFIVAFICSFSGHCNTGVNENIDPEVTKNKQYNAEILKIMKENYLWNFAIPDDIDIVSTGNTTQKDFFESLLYKPIDNNYSRIEETETSVKTRQNKNTGLGASFFLTPNEQEIRVGLVYRETTAHSSGIQPGDLLLSVDNKTDISSMRSKLNEALSTLDVDITCKLQRIDGSQYSVVLRGEEYSTPPVHDTQVFDVGNKKVGYFLYNSFYSTVQTNEPNFGKELDDVYEYFSNQDIDELILDLRYNSGGYLVLANKLLEMLIPSRYNQPVLSVSVNNKGVDGATIANPSRSSLDLNRIFILTSNFTASASELVINCLKPYIEVKHIGLRTSGKPVGNISMSYGDEKYTLVIAFSEYLNANKNGRYYNGIASDNRRLTYYTAPPNSEQDSLVASAINYIEKDEYLPSHIFYRVASRGHQLLGEEADDFIAKQMPPAMLIVNDEEYLRSTEDGR